MSDLHVIFGTGPVGLAVMEELRKLGRQVRLINRSGSAALPDGVGSDGVESDGVESDGVELVRGDASDPAFSRRACAGATVVYQALNPPYARWAELFPPLQQAVLAGAKAAGAKYVSMENLYMYGSPAGRPLTEETPYRAHTRKGRVRARMAEALLEAHRNGEAQVVIARASDFFGPRVRVSAMGERVFPAALQGKPVQLLGNPDKLHSYTYMPDIGRALVLLAEHDEALGQVWHIPSAATLTSRQFVEKIFAAAGHPPKIAAVPKIVLRLVGLFDANLREVLEMVYQFEEDFVNDGSKLERAFGFSPTPLDEAIAATVAWYRARGV